jgi:hypothetical protein
MSYSPPPPPGSFPLPFSNPIVTTSTPRNPSHLPEGYPPGPVPHPQQCELHHVSPRESPTTHPHFHASVCTCAPAHTQTLTFFLPSSSLRIIHFTRGRLVPNVSRSSVTRRIRILALLGSAAAAIHDAARCDTAYNWSSKLCSASALSKCPGVRHCPAVITLRGANAGK